VETNLHISQAERIKPSIALGHVITKAKREKEALNTLASIAIRSFWDRHLTKGNSAQELA